MALNKEELASLYKKRARNYDISANLYYLIGFRETAYRKRAVSLLNLKKGDTVVEVGCGTGLNFRFLRGAVGPEGKVIGVDLTPEMLKQAQDRVTRNGWDNVELIQSDAAAYEFTAGINGVISTFAITLVPEYDRVIRNGAEALAQGGRLVVGDFRRPESWPEWLVKLFVLIMKPFGVTIDLAERTPWESVANHLSQVTLEEHYFKGVYIAVGEK
jgi:demethylmenaquinone methyltransferase/2-methoxy-6-polyprenyl-1,4-benzoquinol methylase